jgi:caffeoyl-CoA O-methyltransferase
MMNDKEMVREYIEKKFVRQDETMQKILKNIPLEGLPAISITPEEGHFIRVLAQMSKVKSALEIGTLGGYSGTWIAKGLLPGGKLTTIEKEQHHADAARKNFEIAGVSDVVEILIGDAHQILRSLLYENEFEFVFIDAEKSGYIDYYDWAVEHIKPNGVICAHNTLRHGKVADESITDDSTQTMRDFNDYVAKDTRMLSTIYPAGDGMLVAVKNN